MSSHGRARRDDPDTSRAAADRVDAEAISYRCMAALVDAGKNGLTVKEISKVLGVDKWSVSPRMVGLEENGLVERTAERRGRSIVWRAIGE